MNDPWDMQGALVNEIAVRALAMISQSLSVVGSKDNERFIHQVMRKEVVPEAADNVIDITQFAVIAFTVLCFFRGGQVVRRVQIVDVKKEKEGTIGIRVQPLLSASATASPFRLTSPGSLLPLSSDGEGLSYVSKPWSNPKRLSSTKPPRNAAVRYP